MKAHRLILTALLGASLVSAAEDPGITKIAKWKDDKACAFILMFDDSITSHVKNVIPELTKRGFTGTFYINPGAGHYLGSKQVWEKDIPAAGFELANHTLTHKGGKTTADIAHEISACNEAIHATTPNLPWPRLISYGQPGGIPKENWPVTKEELSVLLKQNNLIDRPDFGARGAALTLKTGPQMLAHVDKAVAEGSMECIIFHGVGADWIAAPLPVFLELLDGLVERKDTVWITNHIPAHQYATERDAATVMLSRKDAAKMTLNLTCTADPKFYDQALTLITTVPADWTKCRIVQGKSQVEATAKNGSLMYDARPGNEPIIITKQ
ncbi:MAG: hypothetical protein RL693_165 [Verrucomicrobiota bacterium]|jgi:hypothetical protein